MGICMKEIEIIEKYLIYLISECGLSVTLHPMEKDTLITFSSLMRFNTHDNSYCMHVKSKKCGYEKCLSQQRRVFEKISKDGQAFDGICHAGIYEYVYPLRNASEIIGFISVGGYWCENSERKRARLCADFGYSMEKLNRSYKTLKMQRPNKEQVDTLIFPLCKMLELAYLKEEQDDGKEALIKQIMKHIQHNYSTDLTVEDICKQFGCSRSYFSHTFKKESGKSFREYLIDIRLEHAKRLLTLSNLNITEVAFSVGFSDSNYFTNIFRKKNGIPPLAYRKRTRIKIY